MAKKSKPTVRPKDSKILTASQLYLSRDSTRNSHEDFDTPSNPVTSRLNVFYYSLIIACVFCANYKVGEGFEFIRGGRGLKDEQQIVLKFHALIILLA